MVEKKYRKTDQYKKWKKGIKKQKRIEKYWIESDDKQN